MSLESHFSLPRLPFLSMVSSSHHWPLQRNGPLQVHRSEPLRKRSSPHWRPSAAAFRSSFLVPKGIQGWLHNYVCFCCILACFIHQRKSSLKTNIDVAQHQASLVPLRGGGVLSIGSSGRLRRVRLPKFSDFRSGLSRFSNLRTFHPKQV